MTGERATGTVSVWFDDEGWGWIEEDGTHRRIEGVFSEIANMEGYRSLEVGQRVSYANNGFDQAVEIRREPAPASRRDAKKLKPKRRRFSAQPGEGSE